MKSVLNVLFISVLACTTGWGQSTAQIGGTVRDPSGAVLPGVEVTATQTDTSVARSAVTNEVGAYTMTNLPIGPYRLEVSLPGFRTYVQTGILLQVGSNPVLNAVLDVGQVSETVEVQADAALVETRSTGVGQVIDNQRVLELPLNGRQVTELVLLSGMATMVSNNNLQSNGSRNYPTVIISVAGGMQSGLTYILDGGTHNDPWNNLNLPLPFPDALQEFKVETSALPAQYGHHSAAAVNAVTKSGTNDLHGSLFEFLRNGALNARNAFALTRDSLKRNQFGGTLGGPIVKNKLFFFGGYQGTIQHSAPSTTITFVPTPAMLAGDFTTITSPACNSGRQIALRDPYVNNRISPTLFSPPALNLIKYLPTPTDPCGRVQFGQNRNEEEKLIVGRMDYQWNNQHSVFGRFMNARRDVPTDYDGKNILTYARAAQHLRVYSFILGDTYLLSNNTVSSFRGTISRSVTPKSPPEFFSFADLGVRDFYAPIPKFARLRVTGGFAIAEFQAVGQSTDTVPTTFNSTNWQLSEDLSTVKGLHQIGFGANFIHTNMNNLSGLVGPGSFTFSGQNTGMGFSDFMVGRPSNFLSGMLEISYFRQHYIGMYLQDTWKANSRLTLNYGVRWEPFLPAYEKYGHTVHFDQAAFDQGVRSVLYKNAPAGLQFPGDPGMPDKQFHNNQWKHFAPRLGLAWDPGGDGRMSIRAAYGIFFDLPNLWTYAGQGRAYGFQQSINNPPGGFENPWQGQPGGNPFPVTLNPNMTFPFQTQYANLPLDASAPYVNQWNLNVQRQIGTDWLVSGNYLGNSTIHLWGAMEYNTPAFLPGATAANVNQRRRLYLQNPTQGQYYSSIGRLDDGGTTSYHALLLSVQRRRSNGVTVQGNYTLSHCIGDQVIHVFSGGGAVRNRDLERGNCAGDRRHLVNVSTVVETPQFSNRALRTLASGWQVSGIVRLQSGESVTVTSGLDASLTAQGGQRPNQILVDVYDPNKSNSVWLNPAAFAQPVTGTWGNVGTYSVRGPGAVRIDMGLTRTFQIRENQSIQLRAEAFNLPNHVNPGNPITGLNSGTFGQIQSAEDPRIVQLALKYVF